MNTYAGFADDNKWFRDNREKIIDGHHGEEVVIKDRKIKGYYPNITAALEGMKPLVIGECIILQCLTTEEEAQRIQPWRFFQCVQ